MEKFSWMDTMFLTLYAITGKLCYSGGSIVIDFNSDNIILISGYEMFMK